MNLWVPADAGEDTLCLEILQQQSDFFNTNKLFVTLSLKRSSRICLRNNDQSSKQLVVWCALVGVCIRIGVGLTVSC